MIGKKLRAASLNPIFPASDMVAFYSGASMDGSVVYDQIGSNDLTITSTVVASSVSPVSGKTGNYIAIPTSGALHTSSFGSMITGDFNLTFWMKLYTGGQHDQLINMNSGLYNGYKLHNNANVTSSSFSLQNNISNGAGYGTTGNIFSTPSWHHVSINCSAANSNQTYVNNSLIFNLGGSVARSYLGFGRNTSGSISQGANFDLDHIRIYDRLLTVAEVGVIYDFEKP